MSATVIDLKDFGCRTPEQVIRVFYALYQAESVENALWQIFSTCATNEKKGHPRPDPQTTAIANLFDHLIALTRAIHQLRGGTPGTCIICGRSPTGSSS